MREHGRMAEQLVDDVWLWGVQGRRVVAGVLGRVEHLEGKPI